MFLYKIKYSYELTLIALCLGAAALSGCSVEKSLTPPSGFVPSAGVDKSIKVNSVDASNSTLQAVDSGSLIRSSQPSFETESARAQPVVGGIGTDNVREMNLRSKKTESTSTEILIEKPGANVAKPQKNTKMAFVNRFQNSTKEKVNNLFVPISEKLCRTRLKILGVKFRVLPRIKGRGVCGIKYPVEVHSVSFGTKVIPAAKLNCQMALGLARWARWELVPSARLRYLSGVKSIMQMSSYSCRTMNSKKGAAMSEHSYGNALDIGRITLNNGRKISVRKKGLFSFREKSLLKAVRTDSCKYFTTVLGPGSDVHHKDHFHFDLRKRKTSYRHCD